MRPILLSFFPFTVRTMYLSHFYFTFHTIGPTVLHPFPAPHFNNIQGTFNLLPEVSAYTSDKNKHVGFHAISKFQKLCVFNLRYLVERQQHSAETWYRGLRST